MNIKRILYRFKQFQQAVKSHLTFTDVEFVRQYLTKPEQVLFYRMRTFDQKHGLATAQKFLERQEAYSWLDKQKFIRTALLHDVGKACVRVPLFARCLFVLLSQVREGKWLKAVAKEDARWALRKYLYVLRFHGEIGAKMLEEISDDQEIIHVVRAHHHAPEVKESPLLPVMREMDNLV